MGDMWCDFCHDKIKSTVVKVQGRQYEVCAHCESLTVQDKDDIDRYVRKER